MIYCIKDLIEYFNDRENDYMMYDPEWSIGARISMVEFGMSVITSLVIH